METTITRLKKLITQLDELAESYIILPYKEIMKEKLLKIINSDTSSLDELKQKCEITYLQLFQLCNSYSSMDQNVDYYIKYIKNYLNMEIKKENLPSDIAKRLMLNTRRELTDILIENQITKNIIGQLLIYFNVRLKDIKFDIQNYNYLIKKHHSEKITGINEDTVDDLYYELSLRIIALQLYLSINEWLREFKFIFTSI